MLPHWDAPVRDERAQQDIGPALSRWGRPATELLGLITAAELKPERLHELNGDPSGT